MIGTSNKWSTAMSGVELIIFGAGPAIGMAISFIAWLYEGIPGSDGSDQYNQDFLI